MLKTLVLVVEFVVLRVKMACTKNTAKRYAMLSKFERKCDRLAK